MRIKMAYRYEASRPSVTVDDPSEVERLLESERERSISLGTPIIAYMILDAEAPRTAAGLEVGVNRDVGYVVFGEAKVQGHRRQNWATVGSQGGPDVLYGYSNGNYSAEVPASTEIPFERVKAAVIEYMNTDERPTCVAWRPAP